MRQFFSIFLLVIFSVLVCCNRADPKNSRAYIEGKISGTNVIIGEVNVKIISNNVVIAETIPLSDGGFVLSGPLLSDSYELEINKKIKSFSASKPGCVLSADSKKIEIPKGITYLVFNEIIVQ